MDGNYPGYIEWMGIILDILNQIFKERRLYVYTTPFIVVLNA